MERRKPNGYEERRGPRSADNRVHARVGGNELGNEQRLRVPGLRTVSRVVNSVIAMCPLSTAEVRCVPPGTGESIASEMAAVLGLVLRIPSV